ncbi:hypothetical protein [Paraburkholderia sediminicola]|uniref:hypothetical protein n=1 Tax=Paraburkholderia sediminicola TaxID=458836 RepID=UPI00131C0522
MRGLFEQAQCCVEPCEARALYRHQQEFGKHAQPISPIRQRNAIGGGNFPEYEFEMGNLFVYILMAHLTFLKERWMGDATCKRDAGSWTDRSNQWARLTVQWNPASTVPRSAMLS